MDDPIFIFLQSLQNSLHSESQHQVLSLKIDELPIGKNQCVYVHNFKELQITNRRGVTELLGYAENEFDSDLIHTYFHPDEKEIVHRIMQAVIEYARSSDFRSHQGYFYISYRLRKKDGSYIKVMRQSYVYEVASDGSLLSNVSILTDVSNFDTKRMVAWDFIADGINFEKFKKQIGKQYSDFFSPREMEIIVLLEKGLSSNEIGTKLFISPHTVDTHRRKVLKKSSCRNTAELISFCKMNNIL